MSERPVLTLPPRGFRTLSDAERCDLQRWTLLARSAGIDGVEDLTSREWPAVIAGAVIGFFVPGDKHAAWMAVGQEGSWAVASCIDGTISPPVGSLADALAIVYRGGDGSE